MDMAGLPDARPRVGPDMGGFLQQPTYRTQPDMAHLYQGERAKGLRRGPQWTLRSNPAGANASRKIRSSNGVAIVCAGASDTSLIGRTVNGEAWEAIDVGLSLDWAVACGDGKGSWCMLAGLRVATADYVVSRDDGKTWEPRTMPVAGRWSVLEYGNGVLLAIEGQVSSDVAYVSENMGDSWTPATMDRSALWVGAAYSPTVGMWLACATNASQFVSRSFDNGASWEATTSNTAASSVRTIWVKLNQNARGIFINPGGSAATWTVDGSVWGPCSTTNRGVVYNIAFGQDTLILASAFGGEVSTSVYDGITDWNFATVAPPSGNHFFPTATAWEVAYLANGKWAGVSPNTTNVASGVG